jgi:transcriptional regulator with XRE-family HTH domain
MEYARASIGATLKAAREHAGLTQAELAKRLKKSQPMVSGAESGTISVSDRYVSTVLRACGVPSIPGRLALPNIHPRAHSGGRKSRPDCRAMKACPKSCSAARAL